MGHYMTDVLTDAAVQLIESHNATAQPLFLLLSHLAPHAANSDDPMQAPIEELSQFEYITNMTERYYAAMVSRLDKSVGRVIDALARQQLLEQSIVLFLSDNGGPTVGEHSTTASNYPLRGVSITIFSNVLIKFDTSAKQGCEKFVTVYVTVRRKRFLSLIIITKFTMSIRQ